jgi:hypothetical protein
MDKKLVAILAGISLLAGEAVAEIHKSGLHWEAAADHSHVEIPENPTIDVRSSISASGQAAAIALRAILVKAGSPDVLFELHSGRSGSDFSIIEDGVPSEFWFGVTPQEARTGVFWSHTLYDAWQTCLAKRFPDYAVTGLEEGFPNLRVPASVGLDDFDCGL